MTFEQYWALFIKRWRLIVICFILVGLGAYIGSRLIPPTYQSTALVQVAIRSSNNNTQADYNSLLASDQLVQTEAQLAVSDPVLRVVASHYPGLTVEQLSKAVTSTAKPNTQLFEIAVQDGNPKQAAALANDIATTLIQQQLQVVQQDNSQSQQQIQQELTSTRQQIDITTSKIAALQAKGANQTQIAVLQAELAGLQQHYSQWQTILAQLELTQAQSGDFLRIAQPAQPAPIPVRPNRLLNTGAGFLLGLLLGIFLAIILERLDTRIRTPEALSQLLGWSVLATISQADRKEDAINPTGRNSNVEAYRILRTSIGFAAIDKPLRTMVVTSALPLDGKSVISANLAIFMAKAGKNTLLIDADLRRPTLHEKFGIPADKMGLSNAILAFGMPTTSLEASHYQFSASKHGASSSTLNAPKLSLDPFIHAVDIPNLCVIPSGPLPPNPSELLDSKAMQRLLTALNSCGAEIVIFDTPPLLGLSDASILASKVDGTLFVADITRAKKANLEQVKALLEKAGARILGCVVNRQRRSRNDSLYSYYYYRADEQMGKRDNRGMKKANSAAATSTSLDTLKRSGTQAQEDLLDSTVGIAPVPPMEDGKTLPRLDLSDRNTIKTLSVYPVQPETQSRSGERDGRKGS